MMNKPKSVNKKRNKYEFGNYPRYYGYRNEKQEDPRLRVFNSEIFEDKDVLDIGCNSGLLTIAIAKIYKPRCITGIDMDRKLISMARKNLLKQSESIDSGLKNIYFRREDFMASINEEVSPQYECILGLSITKWIQLNWGDDGIMNFFRKVSNLLKEGGWFVLEAQSWSSYKRRRSLNQRTRENYKNCKLRPEGFCDLIVTHFDFKKEAEYKVDKVAGFNRPIYLFKKVRCKANAE
ncbi:hypothetical protein ACOME3_002348 [Neoechinorhynchus agilis]